MNAFGVVVTYEAVYNRECLVVVLEAIALVAFLFQDTVKRLNVGVLVRCLIRNTLMLNACMHAKCVKCFANELRTVVCSYDKLVRLVMNCALQNRLLQRVYDIAGATRLSSVVRDNGAVKHVNDASEEEVTALPGNIAVFYIELPQLVRACNNAVTGYLLGHRVCYFAFRREELELFAESVHFLFVNDQPVFATKQHG